MDVKNEEETTLNRANGNLTIRHAPTCPVLPASTTCLVMADGICELVSELMCRRYVYNVGLCQGALAANSALRSLPETIQVPLNVKRGSSVMSMNDSKHKCPAAQGR